MLKEKFKKIIKGMFITAMMFGVITTVPIHAAEVSTPLYYNVEKITSFGVGNIIYISDDDNMEDPTFQSTNFADTKLSASLKILGNAEVVSFVNGWNPAVRENVKRSAVTKGYDYANGYAVEVLQKAEGFDGCPNGYLMKNLAKGTWHYYCNNGGCKDGALNNGDDSAAVPFTAYRVNSTTLKDTSVDATSKIKPTGPTTYTKADVNVTVDVGNGEKLVLHDKLYEFVDSRVDPSHNEYSITVNVNGVIKTIVLKNLATDKLESVRTEITADKDYYPEQQAAINVIVEAAKVKLNKAETDTDEEINKIIEEAKNAISGIKTKNQIVKEAADKWKKEHETILAKTEISGSDTIAIQNAINAYNSILPESARTDIQNALASEKNKLDNMQKAANYYVDNNKDNIFTKNPLTNADYTNMKNAATNFKNLGNEVKAFVPQSVKERINSINAAEKFKADFAKQINATSVDKTDKTDLEAAVNALNNLKKEDPNAASLLGDDFAKDLVDKVNASKMLDNAPILDSDLGELTSKNFNELMEAVNAYDKLGTAQGVIPQVIKDKIDKIKTVNQWNNTNAPIIAASKIKATDLTNINNALNTFESLDEELKGLIDTDVINALKDKKAVAEMLTKNSVLTKDMNDWSIEDVKALNNAVAAYDDLSGAQENFVDDATKAKIEAARKASEWLEGNNEIIKQATVSGNDLETIKTALADYNNTLDDNARKLVDPAIVKNLQDKQATAQMLAGNTILEKDLAGLTHANLDDLNKAVAAYDKLLDAQKKLVDEATKAKIEAARNASKWLEGNDEIIKKTQVGINDKTAIDNALNGLKGVQANISQSIIDDLNNKKAVMNMLDGNPILKNPIENLTHANLADLNKAVAAYDKLSDDQKKLVDEATKTKIEAARDASEWLKGNDEIIKQATVSGNDLETIQTALADYNALDDNARKLVDPEIVKNLKDKQATAQMLADNAILEKDLADLTHENIAELEEAVNAYDALSNALSGAQENLIDDATKAKIETARDALTWLDTNDTIINQDYVGKDDLDSINKAIEAYESLSEEAKGLIDQNIMDDLLAKKNVAEWADKYDDIISKDANDISADDLADLREAMDAYNALTDEEKAFVDPDVLNAIIASQSNAFVQTYLSDNNGNMYTSVTGNNYKQILSGRTDWENMSQEEKDAVNAMLMDSMGKTYEELIAEAESIQKASESFIDTYLTGKNGEIYKEATTANYKQILSGLDAWNKLTQEEKDAINAKLVENGGIPYEELLKKAKEMKAKIDAGDSTNVPGLSMMLILSMACIMFVRRKKVVLE